MKAIAIMPVRNEEGRYLREALTSLESLVDLIIVLDDCSTDDSMKVCQQHCRVWTFQPFDRPMFDQEWQLRQALFERTLLLEPEWILALDADEFLDVPGPPFRALLEEGKTNCYYFPLFDMWDFEHYRDDELWSAHKRCMPFLFRVKKNKSYHWRERDHHCGRLPLEAGPLVAEQDDPKIMFVDLPVKHFGWATARDRREKYRRYKKLDPEGKFGSVNQYESILDRKPHLVKYQRGPL